MADVVARPGGWSNAHRLHTLYGLSGGVSVMEAENVRPTKPTPKPDTKVWPVVVLLVLLVAGIGGYMVWRAKQDVAEPVAEPVATSPAPTAVVTPALPEPSLPPPVAAPAAEPLPA